MDIANIKTVWRSLGDESVMFPMAMADIAAQIGSHRQLFLDDNLISTTSDIERNVHSPHRYPGNPVFQGTGSSIAFVQKVLVFDETPRFRMWYWSVPDWHAWGQNQEIRFGNSYAVSDNGICWRRPALNLHHVVGYHEQNIVIPYGLMQGVFYEPWEPDVEKRFKALVLVEARKRGERKLSIPEGYYLHTSPDGIHWTGDLGRCVIPSLQGYVLPQSGAGDTSQFWWDSLRRKYIGDIKFVLPGKIRCRGIMESDDLRHWTRPHPTLFAQDPNSQIYGHTGVVYESMYVGMRWIYQPEFLPAPHCMGVELDCSRDCQIWTRVGSGKPFMELNPRLDTWDALQLKIASLLVVDDEIWIYYAAAHGKFPPAITAGGKSTGLARLRLDGFVSLSADAKKGIVETRPLSFSGTKLHVNAEVEKGGEIRVGLEALNGEVVEGFEVASCVQITGNATDTPVAWEKSADLPHWAGSGIRLRFELRKARLYSFRIG